MINITRVRVDILNNWHLYKGKWVHCPVSCALNSSCNFLVWCSCVPLDSMLTHWGPVTPICASFNSINVYELGHRWFRKWFVACLVSSHCLNHCWLLSIGKFGNFSNILRAKFFKRNRNIYLHFMLLPHIDMTQVVEILPHVRQGLTYST